MIRVRYGMTMAVFLLILCCTANGAKALDLEVLAQLAGKVAELSGQDKENTLKHLLKEIAKDQPHLVRRLAGSEAFKDTLMGRLFEVANIELKVFDDDEASAAIGFSYSYSKDIQRHEFKDIRHSGLVLNFATSGNVAFDSDKNPNDFLDSRLSLLLYKSYGGVLAFNEKNYALLNELEDVASAITDKEELNNLPAWQKLSTIVMAQLSDQYYWDFSLNGGLETDQSFDNEQYYYGAHLTFIPKGWNSEQSALAKFNLLDYPAALTRLLTGVDKSWMPRGSAFPEFLFGIDYVDPQQNDLRETIAGDDAEYERLRFEVSFRTLVGHYQGSSAYLEANLRHYQELDPSDNVKSANLDEFTYFTIALTFPDANGLFISYTTGELPFDNESDQVYEIGFKYNF